MNGATGRAALPLIQHLISSHPKIAILTPSHVDFEATSLCYTHRPSPNALAIARPKNADEVCDLVRYCASHSLPFVVRTGGHDGSGRSQDANALTIDMRDINYVHVDLDETNGGRYRTARIGGGCLLSTVARALGMEGLVTPTGVMGFVGYVGWATLGGFGPLSRLYGLGVDQIVGARLVTAAGDVVDADEALLKGIRGAGCALGVIVELTIKAYPLGEVLAGLIMQPTGPDHVTFVREYLGAFDKFLGEAPPVLNPLFSIWDIPGVGKAVVLMVLWASPDQEEGRRWVQRLDGLAPSVLNSVAPTSLVDFIVDNEKLVPPQVHGWLRTISIRDFTPGLIESMADFTNELPAAGNGLCIHYIEGPSAKPSETSVWTPRERHLVLEIVSGTTDEGRVQKCADWAAAFKQDIAGKAPELVVGAGWAPLMLNEESDWAKMFEGNYGFLTDLKRKYDPNNAFQNTVPKLPM